VKILEDICVYKLCIELNIVSYHYKTSASEHPFTREKKLH
jgi:hypothetical protein